MAKWWQWVFDPINTGIREALPDNTIADKAFKFVSDTSNPILGGLNGQVQSKQLTNREQIIKDYDVSTTQLTEELQASNAQLQKEKEEMLAAAAADAEADKAAAAAAAAQQQKLMAVVVLVFAGVVIFLMYKKRKSG